MKGPHESVGREKRTRRAAPCELRTYPLGTPLKAQKFTFARLWTEPCAPTAREWSGGGPATRCHQDAPFTMLWDMIARCL